MVIEHLLKKPAVKVLVIGPKGDEDTIWGWIAHEFHEDDYGKKHVIHYIYIKETFQKMGLARKLFSDLGIDENSIKNIHFTHWTFPVDEAMKRWPEMIYDPYKL